MKKLVIVTIGIILIVVCVAVSDKVAAMWDEPGGSSYPPPAVEYPTYEYPPPVDVTKIITGTVEIGEGEPPTTRGPGCVGACPTQAPGWPWAYPTPGDYDYPTPYPEP